MRYHGVRVACFGEILRDLLILLREKSHIAKCNLAKNFAKIYN